MEKETKNDELLNTVAKVISVLFHPLVIPVYCLLVLFSSQSTAGFLNFNIKKLLFLMLMVNNVILPVALLPVLIHLKIINSWSMNERRERTLPLIITTFFYGITSYMIFRLPVPLSLKTFIMATAMLALLVTIINFTWKISIHSVGAGALSAIVLLLSLRVYYHPEIHLIAAVLISGLILTSRLKLNEHVPSQVWTGFIAGFAGLILFMSFAKQFV